MFNALYLRDEFKKIAHIAAPLAFSYLTEMAMGITDMIVVGRLGKDELAAVGLSQSLLFDILMVCMGILSIISIQISHANATQDRSSMARYVQQGVILSAIFSLPALLFCLFSKEIFTLAHQDPIVIELGSQYLRACIGIIFPILLFTVFRNLMGALNKANQVFYILFFCIFLNGFLNYLLVFGKWGLPALGVTGAGVASSIVCIILCVSLIVRIYYTKEFAGDAFLTWPKLHIPTLLTILKLGGPIGVIVLMENGFFTAVNMMTGLFGATALAAGQIIYYLLGICALTAYGIGEAAGIRIAFNLGKQQPQRARHAAQISLLIGLACMSFFAFWIILHPTSLVAVFLDVQDAANEEVVNMAKAFLHIGAFFIVFDCLQAISMRALRGYSDTFIPMWISMFGFWCVGMGSSVLFAFVLDWGVSSLWWGLAIGLFVTALILLGRLNHRSNALIHHAIA